MGSSLVPVGNAVASERSSLALIGRIVAPLGSDLVPKGSFNSGAGRLSWQCEGNFYGGDRHLRGFPYVSPRVSPLAQGGPDEAFGLTVGARCVRSRESVFQAQPGAGPRKVLGSIG